ncbi:MAG TPA: NAD-dependent epimerase/dehydratase family protein [Acetobacteraceae bacterium]|nr:NAD-dependent epimerase/dehydratase family protein [Acetobacteraceae bacterium]
MAERVLVLGAGGFIGGRVVAGLARGAWAVPVAAGRRPVRIADAPAVESISLDACDPAGLARALEGSAAVVNCIAGDPKIMAAATRALFATAGKMQTPPRIVHLSSLAVYGSAPREVDEAAPFGTDVDAYGAAKIEGEQLASGYPRGVVLRPGIVYGPESPLWSEYIGRLLQARRLGDLGGAGQGTCNLVHVGDVAAAVLESLRRPVEGRAFNLAAPSPPSWNEYLRLYARALGAEPLRRLSPARLALELRLLGPGLKLAALLLRSEERVPPPIRPWLLELCARRVVMIAREAGEALGLAWTPLQSGLDETARWFRRWR